MKNGKILPYAHKRIEAIMLEDYWLRLERITSNDDLEHYRLIDTLTNHLFTADITLDQLRIELAKEHYPLEEV